MDSRTKIRSLWSWNGSIIVAISISGDIFSVKTAKGINSRCREAISHMSWAVYISIGGLMCVCKEQEVKWGGGGWNCKTWKSTSQVHHPEQTQWRRHRGAGCSTSHTHTHKRSMKRWGVTQPPTLSPACKTKSRAVKQTMITGLIHTLMYSIIQADGSQAQQRYSVWDIMIRQREVLGQEEDEAQRSAGLIYGLRNDALGSVCVIAQRRAHSLHWSL